MISPTLHIEGVSRENAEPEVKQIMTAPSGAHE